MRPDKLEAPSDLPEELRPFFETHFTKGRFFNPWENAGMPKMSQVLKWQFGRNPHRKQKKVPPLIEPLKAPLEALESLQGESKICWLGHASFLLQLGDARVLIDPIFGHMMGGVFRRKCQPPVAPEELGRLDAVLITHGHYDHLDKPSVNRLAKLYPGAQFLVPLGMQARLPRACRHVVEFDWWDRLCLGDLRFTFVPAQHWYRRGAFDLNRVLWGGWVVSGDHQIYHSGDTGFFPGFEAIGRMIPGIDVALLPLGAYEPEWFMAPQHMRPKDALRAFELLEAKHFLGMHWGTFDLSDEPLDGGVAECRRLIGERSYPAERLHVLRPGGVLALQGDDVAEAGPYNASKQSGSSPSAASASGESASF